MKRTPVSLLLAACILTWVVQVSHSSTIQQVHYQFQYEGMARERVMQKMFVVCDKCPERTLLVKATKPLPVPPISLRLSKDTYVTPIREPFESKYRSVTVYFEKNSHTLKDSEIPKLAIFARTAKQVLAENKNSIVRVEGFTCDLGKKATNDNLARNRARTVAAFLEKKSIHAGSVTGEGKCCYATDDPSQRRLNRRVEAKITSKGEKH